MNDNDPVEYENGKSIAYHVIDGQLALTPTLVNGIPAPSLDSWVLGFVDVCTKRSAASLAYQLGQLTELRRRRESEDRLKKLRSYANTDV